MDNADRSAYPITQHHIEDGKLMLETYDDGLSKRERFAMAAMQGLARQCNSDYAQDYQLIAKMAVSMADETLNALEDTND